MIKLIQHLILTLVFVNLAIAQSCPKNNSQDNFIKIIQKQVEPKIYDDLNVNVFNDTSNLHNTKIVMGLTLGRIALSSDFKIKILKVKENFCASIEKVSINYSLDSLDVYLPKDFPKESCNYEEVKNHELEHVEIYTNTYKQYLSVLRDMIENRLANKSKDSILIKDTNDAEHIFKDDINQLLEEFNKKLKLVLNKRHKKIDTEENYAKIAAKCKNWSDLK